MDTMALFYSTDDKPKFGYTLCNEQTLTETVAKHMFPGGNLDAEHRAEVASIAEELLEKLGTDFEDGWLALRVGMNDVAEFLMEKVTEQAAEAAWADDERGKEWARRYAAEQRFNALKTALIDALGPKAPEVAAAAAA